MHDNTGIHPSRLALLLAMAASPALHAQDNAEPPVRLEEMTVTATYLPRQTEDIAGTVSVMTAQEIERQIAEGLDDLTRYQPGLSMSTASRGGNEGFIIRGIGGNRVLTVIDGIRSADFYAAGPSSYGKDMFETDDLRAVEIIRGPASVLYGADAMGGAVLLRTKSAADYLGPGESQHLALNTSGTSDNDQYKVGVTWATRGESLDTVLQWTGRRFREREINGDARLNPQDGETGNVFWKTGWRVSEPHTLTLTAEHNDETVDTVLESDLGSRVFDSRGSDRTRRQRVSLEHVWTPDSLLSDRLVTRLHWQTADGEQNTEQRRISYAFINPANPASFAGTEARRESNFHFDQTTTSASILSHKTLSLGATGHALIYGATTENTRTERPRYRCDTALTSGETRCAIPSYPMAPPEQFPNKTFPDTDTTRSGLFLQDEITLGDSGLVMIPGLRLDHYRLEARPDALFDSQAAIAPGGILSDFRVEDVTETEASMNLGLLYSLDDQWTLFGQYAEGFRPPNFDEANQAFANLGHGYAIAPNPRLEPEYSEGLEAGIRFRGESARLSLALYHNRYRNFIESRMIGNFDGISVFQDDNIGRARIRGAELNVDWYLSDNLFWRNAAAWSRGENRNNGAHLDSVEPLTLVTGLHFLGGDGRWGLQGTATLADGQDRVSAPDRVRGEEYAVLDLTGHYDLSRAARLRFGVFNLFDTRYARWNSLSGLAADDEENIALSQAPGRHARLAFRYEF
ncbi:MAG: TonB-dependent hemoglobin/transferrin/lactoferrin family receptor [Pseudomonadota bacterium]